MQTTEDLPVYSRRLGEIVDVDQQPTLYELYSPKTYEDIQSLFVKSDSLTSKKTIIVYGSKQYFGNDHSALIIGQILERTPSMYMQMIESLRLNGCGFIAHELFNDGHVCKYADRESYLDCAHSIARKVLESAMALVANEGSQESGREVSIKDENEFAAFSNNDNGIAKLDRALGEVARGPVRDDSISILSAETQLVQISEYTGYHDLMTMLPVLRPELKRKQAEYGEPLLRLAKEIAPKLYHVLQRRLKHWQRRRKDS
jgi:hypothetical protein